MMKREREEEEEQQSPEKNKSCDEGFDTDSGPTQAELDHARSDSARSDSDKVNLTRERNRIHSRQTRLRRKAKSNYLKDKILELSKEVRTAHS